MAIKINKPKNLEQYLYLQFQVKSLKKYYWSIYWWHSLALGLICVTFILSVVYFCDAFTIVETPNPDAYSIYGAKTSGLFWPSTIREIVIDKLALFLGLFLMFFSAKICHVLDSKVFYLGRKDLEKLSVLPKDVYDGIVQDLTKNNIVLTRQYLKSLIKYFVDEYESSTNFIKLNERKIRRKEANLKKDTVRTSQIDFFKEKQV